MRLQKMIIQKEQWVHRVFLPNEEPNHTTFLKLSNSIDIQTLKDLKQGLDDIIKLVEQFKD